MSEESLKQIHAIITAKKLLSIEEARDLTKEQLNLKRKKVDCHLLILQIHGNAECPRVLHSYNARSLKK